MRIISSVRTAAGDNKGNATGAHEICSTAQANDGCLIFVVKLLSHTEMTEVWLLIPSRLDHWALLGSR
jgi:hypothetical protein